MPFAVALEHTKYEANIGTVLRSAYNFGAAAVFTIGRRYKLQRSDTMNTYSRLPVLDFRSWDEYAKHTPLQWIPIGVEVGGKASLSSLTHPYSAVYLFGPEDGMLSRRACDMCKTVVSIPTNGCLNLAVTAAIVMYDRQCKGGLVCP